MKKTLGKEKANTKLNCSTFAKTRKRKSARDNGITLIALIVTIIVLLILAGVTINLAIKDNGIFKRAANATTAYNIAEQKEDQAMKNAAETMDEYAKQYGIDLPSITPTTKAGTKVSNPSAWGTSLVSAVSANPPSNTSESKTVAVPIPQGFYYVGGDVSTGVIISDNESDAYEEGKDKTTREYALNLVGNQFVWIPATESSYKRNETWYIENDNEDDAKKDELTLSAVTDFATTDTDNGINSTVCQEIVSQINAEKECVKKFGGFYIGRYETGVNNVIKANVDPYANIKWSVAYEKAKTTIDSSSAKTYLVSSYAWDTAIQCIMDHTSYKSYATSRNDMNENWYDKEVTDTLGNKKAANTAIRLKCRINNTKISNI